jgi:C4-dicarboxylate transporter DctM subunit
LFRRFSSVEAKHVSPLILSALGLGAVLTLSALRMPIALALGLVGAAGTGWLKGWNTFEYVAGTTAFRTLDNYSLSVIPLFILMGAFAVNSGLSNTLVQAANAFIGHRRGGLAMASVAACAGFGAITHSDMATLTTMTRVTVPEMLRLGYNRKLAAGALAAGATLAVLVPPSVPLIIYSYMTQTSLNKLYSAAIIPAFILLGLHLATISLWVKVSPSIAPTADRASWHERTVFTYRISGLVGVLVLIMAGIYFGLFSPTEGGAVGATGTLLLGIVTGQLNWFRFVRSVREAIHFSAVIFLLTIGIEMFHFFMDSAGLPKFIANYIIGLNMSPTLVMAAIVVTLMLLGTVIEAIAILFIATPFLYPIIVGLGFDPVWFGIMMMMIIELGLIIPPLGLNVYLLSSMVEEITIGEAFKGCAPFVVADIIMISITFIFPEIVLWLPSIMK